MFRGGPWCQSAAGPPQCLPPSKHVDRFRTTDHRQKHLFPFARPCYVLLRVAPIGKFLRKRKQKKSIRGAFKPLAFLQCYSPFCFLGLFAPTVPKADVLCCPAQDNPYPSLTVCLTPSLPQPVNFPGRKMHRRACKPYIFRSYNIYFQCCPF